MSKATFFSQLAGLFFFLLLVSSCVNTIGDSRVKSSYKRDMLDREVEKYRNFRGIYTVMSPGEKSIFWKERIRKISKENHFTFNEQSFLIKLDTCLLPEFFILVEHDNSVLIMLANEAIRTFGKDRAGFIFSSFADNYQTYEAIMSKDECGCSTKSDWCLGFLDCVKSDCDSSKISCGFLLEFKCDGMCK